MASTRRTFLKAAGVVGAAAATGRMGEARAAAPEAAPGAGAAPPAGLTTCNLRRNGDLVLGVRTRQGILDVGAASHALKIPAPRTTDDLVRGRDAAGLKKLLSQPDRTRRFLVKEDAAQFGPALAAPEKIIMMGFNYKKHCAEVHIPIPTTPVFFNKYNNALLGHGGTIQLPTKVAKQFDYEVELVVVIGKPARDVSDADALSHVYGYCTGNDFSARDLQFKTSQFMLGKTSDGFAPLGPWLVSADQVPDPQKLKLTCSVNGQVRQSSNTDDMIFTCAQLVAYASRHMTLQPGDIIFTGTPEGVILGKPEAERVWLKPGDQLATEIEGLGELRFSLSGPTA